MKILSSLCLGLLAFSAFAEGVDTDTDESHATIYSDISKKAQQNAIRYDGWKLIGGLTYSMSSFCSGSNDSAILTENNMNNFMLTAGLDYSKRFKKKFLLGAVGILDFWKAQKISGDWNGMNYEFHSRECEKYMKWGSLDAELKTPCVVPEISLKGGYIFRNMGSVVYLKAGAQYLKCEYLYTNAGLEVASYSAIKFVPLIGIGGQRRINKKLGLAFEINVPFRKNFEKKIEGFVHKTRMGRKTIRMLVTYTIPGKMK